MRSYLALTISITLAACGDGNKVTADASPDGPAVCTTGTVSGMGMLQDFCKPADPGPNGVLVTASGEALAASGYRLPPVSATDFALVDGWDITFSAVVSTFDHVQFSRNPDKSPSDQSQCESASGAAVLCNDPSAVPP